MAYSIINIRRGVAQLVARLTGGQEAASSSLVTPTNPSVHKDTRIFLFSSFVMDHRISPPGLDVACRFAAIAKNTDFISKAKGSVGF